MPNFFFTRGEGGSSAINLDQIRLVLWDNDASMVTAYFEPNHTMVFRDEAAEQFLDALKRSGFKASRVRVKGSTETKGKPSSSSGQSLAWN
jgi:hypothetical protein